MLSYRGFLFPKTMKFFYWFFAVIIAAFLKIGHIGPVLVWDIVQVVGWIGMIYVLVQAYRTQ